MPRLSSKQAVVERRTACELTETSLFRLEKRRKPASAFAQAAREAE